MAVLSGGGVATACVIKFTSWSPLDAVVCVGMVEFEFAVL